MKFKLNESVIVYEYPFLYEATVSEVLDFGYRVKGKYGDNKVFTKYHVFGACDFNAIRDNINSDFDCIKALMDKLDTMQAIHEQKQITE